MTDLFAHVLVRDIVAHGANAATVLAQIRFKLHVADREPDERPWYTPPPKRKDGTSELQRLSGLSGPQVRRAMTRLVEDGALEAAQLNRSEWDQRYSYRPAEPIEEPPVCRDDDSGTSKPETGSTPDVTKSSDQSDGSRGSSSSEETTINPTPTPPEGGDDEAAPSLLDELPVGQRGADRRSEQRKRAAAAEVPPMIVAQFETWLDRDWPGAKRNTTNARAVFAKVLTAGETVADLQRQARNYRRGLEIWAETFGEDRKPMGVGPFLAYRGKPAEGKRHLWDQATPADVTVEHCRDVIGWPPPPGRTWERPKRRRSLADLGVAGG